MRKIFLAHKIRAAGLDAPALNFYEIYPTSGTPQMSGIFPTKRRQPKTEKRRFGSETNGNEWEKAANRNGNPWVQEGTSGKVIIVNGTLPESWFGGGSMGFDGERLVAMGTEAYLTDSI